MANFITAFEAMIRNEGGYVLHNVKGDRGGQTYAGIARNRWPEWSGWHWIDKGQLPPTEDVRTFYRMQFWIPLEGDKLVSDTVAQALFDFAVNAGTRTAIKLAQIVIGTTPDGKLGPKTLAALNAIDPEKFCDRFALARVARYAAICSKDKSQLKFLLGWINRTLKGLA